MRLLWTVLIGLPLVAADPIFELAKRPQAAEFRESIQRVMKDADIKAGKAVFAEGGNFLFATEADSQPILHINDERNVPLQAINGTKLWFASVQVRPGTSYNFHYMVAGKVFGGRTDVAAYLPDCYEQPGVPKGKISEKITHTSKIYDGMVSDYWVYVPAQYDAATPAALMVWQDGQGLVDRNGGGRTQIVIDNLIHQKRIPVMIQVFIAPGNRSGRAMRSVEYDTVNDTYPRFLRDEILAEVQAKYNIRRDAYSRGIGGSSSGGICAFNAAWHQPDQFSRVHSRVGSFTSIQWHPGTLEGGNVYPFKIRKEPMRNIRVWLQDGNNDLENNHGSWPLQNIQMANSLKMRGYDFHLSFGTGSHNGAHASSELPVALAWLWRDYDPSKTAQKYEQEAAEKDKPLFRVVKLNRE